MVPHKVHGTHIFFYNKIYIYAFYKKARKSLTFKTIKVWKNQIQE